MNRKKCSTCHHYTHFNGDRDAGPCVECRPAENKLPNWKPKYHDMVKGLCKPGQVLIDQLTPQKAHVQHMAIGISGEAGELLDAVKKYTVYNKTVDLVNIVEELGDIEFYLEGLRQGFGVTREETLLANIAKLGKRYEGLIYSDAAAQARADKQ